MANSLARRLSPFVVVALASCDSPTPVDRAAIYGELATNVIAPAYASLRTETGTLAAAASAYCADPSSASAFASLRVALETAHRALVRTTSYEFDLSPVVAQQLPVLLDSFPANTASVDAILADSAPIDLATQPASVQGFYTLEYLLHSPVDATSAQATFTDAGTGARRCAYVVAATSRVATLADTAADQWDPPSATTFGDDLLNAGRSGSAYATISVATTDVLARMYTVARDLTDDAFGAPLGILAMGSGIADPTLVHGRLAGWTKADALAALDSIESLYYGRLGAYDGRGVEDILESRSAARAEEFEAQLAAARASIEAIPLPIDQAIVDSNASPLVMAAFDACKTVETSLSTTIGPLLGAFAAAFVNDGD